VKTLFAAAAIAAALVAAGSASAPATTSWALMLLGFAGMGAMLRDRRRLVTVAA
jgi:hypothetical protein